MSKIQLSEIEAEIAQRALQSGYQRETSALIDRVRSRASSIEELEDLWNLHDLLSTKRYEIDGKYVYDAATIVFDLARLIKEGWLTLEDLAGLNSEMIAKISVLTRI